MTLGELQQGVALEDATLPGTVVIGNVVGIRAALIAGRRPPGCTVRVDVEEDLCTPVKIKRRSAARGCRSRTRPTSTSSSAMLAKFEQRRDHAGRVAGFPPRCAAPTDSGRPPTRRCCASRFRRASSRARSSTRSADVAERVLARLRPHHHAAERPAALPEAARRRAGDAAARGCRPDDARSVRELGAEHHRVPVRRASRATKRSTSRRMPKR